MLLTADRLSKEELKRERTIFAQARKVESEYSRQLRMVGRHVGELVKAFGGEALLENPALTARLQQLLNNYSETLVPWAEVTGRRMLAEVSRKDEQAWARASRLMSRNLKDEIRNAPTGQVLRQFLSEQVTLITSLPLHAGRRVHRLTTEGITQGRRAKEIAGDILKTGHVTESRAMLIARTEVARTSSGLTMARAQHIGSDGYIWRTSEDSDVRPLHRKLNGTFHKWDDPPIAGERGERAHAGMIYNCRCYPEPVIPDEIN